jgi:hypothetical protein
MSSQRADPVPSRQLSLEKWLAAFALRVVCAFKRWTCFAFYPNPTF